jgi:hypothetical protein
MRVDEEENEKGAERLFEKIMAENSPGFNEKMVLHIFKCLISTTQDQLKETHTDT